MKPKEGTILTVAKSMSDKGVELAEQTEDILEMIRLVIEAGERMPFAKPRSFFLC